MSATVESLARTLLTAHQRHLEGTAPRVQVDAAAQALAEETGKPNDLLALLAFARGYHSDGVAPTVDPRAQRTVASPNLPETPSGVFRIVGEGGVGSVVAEHRVGAVHAYLVSVSDDWIAFAAAQPGTALVVPQECSSCGHGFTEAVAVALGTQHEAVVFTGTEAALDAWAKDPHNQRLLSSCYVADQSDGTVEVTREVAFPSYDRAVAAAGGALRPAALVEEKLPGGETLLHVATFHQPGDVIQQGVTAAVSYAQKAGLNTVVLTPFGSARASRGFSGGVRESVEKLLEAARMGAESAAQESPIHIVMAVRAGDGGLEGATAAFQGFERLYPRADYP